MHNLSKTTFQHLILRECYVDKTYPLWNYKSSFMLLWLVHLDYFKKKFIVLFVILWLQYTSLAWSFIVQRARMRVKAEWMVSSYKKSLFGEFWILQRIYLKYLMFFLNFSHKTLCQAMKDLNIVGKRNVAITNSSLFRSLHYIVIDFSFAFGKGYLHYS